MNKIYKVIYSKAKHSFVVVSELAHSHTKPAAMAGTTRRGLSALVLTALLMSVSPAAFAATENVVYDSDGKTITLENTDGNGTKIQNVADGFLGAGSQDAVNGRQLYSTNLRITDIADALTKNNSIIAQAQTDITRVKTQNITFKSDINTLKTQVTTGWNATIDGAKVKTVNPSSNSLNFSAGDDISLVDPGNGSIKVSVTPTGAVADGNTHAVSGGTVYTAIQAEQTARTQADTDLSNKIGSLDNNGNYIQKDASVSSNLSTLDTQVKSNADAIDKEKTDREAAITNVTNNIGDLSNSAVKYDADSNKGKVTLAGEGGTTITNVKDGALSDSSTDAVTGKQLYAEQQARTQAVTDLTNKVGSLDANGNYIQKDASVSSNLSTLDTQVKSNADAIDKEKTDREAAITNITNNIGDLSNNAVKYDADSNKGKVTLAGEGGTTITNVKDGALSDSSTDAVTGKQLYAEQQARTQAVTDLTNKVGSLDANGNYIQKDASVSSNLSTLDTQVKSNTDAIDKEKTDRENAITNVTNNLNSLTDSAVQYDADTNKTKVTLAGNGGTTLTNVKAGGLSDSSLDAVNGSQLYAEQQARIQAVTNINNTIGTLRGNAVLYDTDAKDLVTFGGSKGTRLTNLKDAALTATSTDAVTGRQLYTTNQNISGFADQIAKNAGKLESLATSVTNSLDSVSAMSESVSTIDSTKADASLNNLSAEGLQVITNAANNAVQAYMKNLKSQSGTTGTQTGSSSSAPAKAAGTQTVSLASLSKMAVSPNSPFVSLAATGTPENVVYDSDGKTITLENTDGNGTKIQNVADGFLGAGSQDAVNGRQLYATNLRITDIADALSKNNSTIAQAQTDITRVKTQNITFKSDINTLKTQVGTGWNATINGAKLKTVNPSSNMLNFTDGDDIALTDAGNGSLKVAVKASGKVEAGDFHVVTGDAVYQAIKNMPTTGSLSGKANTALDNINDAGKTVIRDLAKDVLTDSLATKANTDASNIDASAYAKKLGTGTNAQGSTGLVTGDTLYNAVKDKADKSYVDEGLSKKADKDSVYTKDETYNRAEIDDKVQKVSQDLSGKADTDLGNLTDAGKTVITDLAKGSVKVVAGKNTTVTEGTKDGAKTYAVNVEDSAIQKAVQPKLDQKANVDASNLTADNVASWQKALGTGSIDKDSTGLVTGQVVYQAIKDMPTGEGLVKYDEGTKTITVAADKDATKVDFSGKDSDGHTINRTITGIVTDAKDATSAANVGYVQDVAGSLANGVQRVANQLSHDINKVGAGAAALAGLHPGEFDPDNKLDFAAGYGHYKGANAGALGAYYHPNEDTIISLAGTMGNGDPMLSAGVTFKLGPSGPNTLSRTALTKQVAKDQQTIKALAGELANVKDQLNRVLSILDMSKKAPFSDVPADHWAKDAVDTLHGNGAIKGYPDGKFHGDKPMTRYEYAQMLYEALQKGAHVDQATLDEYAPELSQVKANNQK